MQAAEAHSAPALSNLDTRPALAAVDEKRILDLEQRSVRTRSSAFEEGEIADLYANYMADMGLEVEVQSVAHPFDPTRSSRQPIGRLKGSGGGKTLLINGHMDPGAEMSGWTVDPTAPNSRTAGFGEWARMTTRAGASLRFARSKPSSAPARA